MYKDRCYAERETGNTHRKNKTTCRQMGAHKNWGWKGRSKNRGWKGRSKNERLK